MQDLVKDLSSKSAIPALIQSINQKWCSIQGMFCFLKKIQKYDLSEDADGIETEINK